MSELVLVNPKRKRRRKTTRRRKSVARRSPTRRRRVRRNPKMQIAESFGPAMVGAGGALGLDMVWGMLPLPANMKTGMMGSVVKIGGALVLGQMSKGFLGKRTGENLTVGMVTVLTYDMVKGLISQNMPGVPMSEYIGSELSGSNFAYNPQPGLGYMNAAQGVVTNGGHTLGAYIGSEAQFMPSDGLSEAAYYS